MLHIIIEDIADIIQSRYNPVIHVSSINSGAFRQQIAATGSTIGSH